MSRGLLMLPAAAGDLPAVGGLVLNGMPAMVPKVVEPAGQAYQMRLTGAVHTPDDQRSDGKTDEQVDSDGADEDSPEHRKLQKLTRDSDDFYELLELGHMRWRATEDDIRKAFRKMSLKYHPDKLRQAGHSSGAVDDLNSQDQSNGLVPESELEDRFKRIKKAYDVLADNKKRAAYDSIDDFDDSLPTWNPKAEYASRSSEFYARFGKCFDLNARWSTASRVPHLGDDSTALEEVEAFYDFWFNFKSWREFSLDQEYDPDEAESRDERRWIERQNAKQAKARKLEEAARIRSLAESAYRYDPRILKMKEEQREAKEAVKRKKREEKEAVELALRAKQESAKREAAKKEEEEKVRRQAEKREREKARKALQKARRRLRDCCASQSDVVLTHVEYLCSEMTAERIEALCQTLEAGDVAGNSTKIADIVTSATESLRSERDNFSSRDTSEDQSPVAQEREWSVDELSMLSKALCKFPAGTRERWDRVSLMLESRSANECLRKANELRSSSAQPEVAKVNAFERFQQKKKHGTTSANHSQEEATQKPNFADGPPNTLAFSKKQQSNLEEAMKKYPASLGPERWQKVASAVPGRSPRECEERFKELVAYFKAKKGAK